jgi:hypothetical protein
VDSVVVIDFVTTVICVVTLAIAETNRDLDRIGTICAGVVVPAAASDIEFATEER